MLTSDFDYNLPENLIAQVPLEPRDSSRLMVIDKEKNSVEHKRFFDIVDFLQKGDLLVWNNTKVFKARLRGYLMLDENVIKVNKNIDSTDKILNSSPVEIFLVKPMENNKVWKVLAKPGRKLRLGMKVVFAEDFSAEVMLKENDGTYLIQFDEDDMSVRAKANKYGEVPTPPYVDNPELKMKDKELSEKYQTVYAKEEGSVAAPTAGFHFTPNLIEKLKAKGVEFAEVTLHVGLGTFLPVKTDKIEEHKMHEEWVEITSKNADLINAAKAEGRRVVAVGTTTVRVLEGVTKTQGSLRPYTGDINIFIYPGFKFQVVDALITNFHLPKSTLLMLVSAFVGNKDFMLECYQKAVEEKYRFFSFGDAMLIK
ncbi:MAG: tRNA preQ1(34) S-adenosylmethionine ribosyltransferase-isomerase QueA [Candidatus Magasanikbacteria bacterium RIFOXYD2_FULL_39_9]|uniref:S-adenosylmethionine:tRNA ribosyltransferase-isomerase n=1 Tax=Candidatus Magasanikbacteria bacterium RIFOXYD1_FULL_40_23 TaxID=1798705 RepID=A0A1F6P8M2_9BACT|nr:MAG: tRNA preQ1(34) S-adenosylmethionine ribosyltransferase-isomerase QueA [Candidatus Magasanikbacteria bacterium RIFOXYD2_FULL_39_9]OGH92294.1 MAG: tRNA preQ1(34) S-adenosylmethionine ribosyltransferase-isomerase QueA [Candidatus Magasanikbacteria bacterium RIFOXYD1_FULL_40_23]